MVQDRSKDLTRYRIARLSPAHAGCIAAIEVTWNPCPWTQQVFEAELGQSYSISYGAFAGVPLVGYLCAHRICDEAHIVSFAVAVAARGSGLGELLLSTFLGAVAASGVVVVTLDVRASNKIAQRLYQKVGFSVVGVRKHYYASNNEDALTMRVHTPHTQR